MDKEAIKITKRGRVDVLAGKLWGDEGKGKIIDKIAPGYDVFIRANGGGNAGHTVCDGNNTHVLHYIPCAVLHTDKTFICAAGMAINPVDFMPEVLGLEKINPNLRKHLFVSHQATLITPIHVAKDMWRENGTGVLGSTKKGISFAYADDTEHKGFRLSDILKYSSREFLAEYENYRKRERKNFPLIPILLNDEISQEEKLWLKKVDQMRASIQIVDTVKLANELLLEGKNILIEGAQAVLLDGRHGCYPHNTSSHTTPQMLVGYAGLPMNAVRDVIAVTKWYGTRVGGVKPLSAMEADIDELFRQTGHEFGTTTGRARTCVWPDELALRESVTISHPNKLYITKMDVCPVDVVKIAVEYILKNKEHVSYPPMNLSDVETVVYKEVPGWKFENKDSIPENAINFIARIKKLFPFIEIAGIGVGPNRDDIIYPSSNDLNKIVFNFEHS